MREALEWVQYLIAVKAGWRLGPEPDFALDLLGVILLISVIKVFIVRDRQEPRHEV
jgi:hypothetical protein